MKNEFVKLYKKHIKRRGADKLLGYLVDKGFLEAPASTKYHGSYEGGLVEHSVNVMNRLMKKEVLQGYTKETIAIVGLLHDVHGIFPSRAWGKINLYHPAVYELDG